MPNEAYPVVRADNKAGIRGNARLREHIYTLYWHYVALSWHYLSICIIDFDFENRQRKTRETVRILVGQGTGNRLFLIEICSRCPWGKVREADTCFIFFCQDPDMAMGTLGIAW